jgi:octaprenyl-diphosphate synthase
MPDRPDGRRPLEPRVKQPDATVTTAAEPAPQVEELTREHELLARVLAEVQSGLDDVERALDDVMDPPAGYVSKLVDHVRGFGGKRLRPALVVLAGRAVDAHRVGEVHARVGAVVELIHTATLVHDDILDGAILRRRRPTLNALEGVEVSVLLGDFLLASAYAEAASLEDRLASRYLSKITRLVCQGEMLQIHHRGDLDLSESRYLEIIEKKTAVLYAAACEVGARYAGGTDAHVRALHDYGLALGMGFQIIDDVLDLVGDEAVVGKSLGTDLSRCKMTLPMIHFLVNGPREERTFVRRVLENGQGGEESSRIRELVLAAGSVDFARSRAGDQVARARECLASLPRTPARSSLEALAEYVLERRR